MNADLIARLHITLQHIKDCSLHTEADAVALREAIAALEGKRPYMENTGIVHVICKCPQCEAKQPVAWIQSNHLDQIRRNPKGAVMCRFSGTKLQSDFVPLYTNESSGEQESNEWMKVPAKPLPTVSAGPANPEPHRSPPVAESRQALGIEPSDGGAAPTQEAAVPGPADAPTPEAVILSLHLVGEPGGIDERVALVAIALIESLERERDALREAAKVVCWFDWSSNDEDAYQAINNLQAVLDAAIAGEAK